LAGLERDYQFVWIIGGKFMDGVGDNGFELRHEGKVEE